MGTSPPARKMVTPLRSALAPPRYKPHQFFEVISILYYFPNGLIDAYHPASAPNFLSPPLVANIYATVTKVENCNSEDQALAALNATPLALLSISLNRSTATLASS